MMGSLMNGSWAGLAAIALLLLADGAVADAPIELDGAWARATPPAAHTAAGYLAITNAGGQSDRLVGASSPRAETVEIHEMTVDNGVARMRHLPQGIPLPPGETVALEPGGRHLMFMGLDRPFREGETVAVTLTFETSGARTLQMPVLPLGAAGPQAAPRGLHDGHGH
jgi:periplasmic copper chaperone A